MGPTKWWSTLNTRRERTSEVLRGPCRVVFVRWPTSSVCHVMDWCGPRRCSSPEAATWWSDRHQCPKPLDFFYFISHTRKACLVLEQKKKKKSELEAARRLTRGGATMTSAVQEPATATMPTFFPAAVDGAVL